MCESTAYYVSKDGTEKIMENVICVIPQSDGIFLEDILGEQITAKGTISEIKLLDHKILIKKA